MALLKSSDIAFELPVTTITAKGERWICRNLDHLTRVVPIQLKSGRFLGMKITDASNRRWVVRSIRKTGRADRWNILDVLLFSPPDWRVEYLLEELPPLSRRGRGSPQGSGTRSPHRDPRPSGGDGLESPPDSGSDQTSETSHDRDATHLDWRSTVSDGATAVVKASNAHLEYPLIGFTRTEGALAFSDSQVLTTCAASYVFNETLIGMELVDNRLRRWTVRSLLLQNPLPKRRWWQLSVPTATFDLELEEIEPIDLKELQRRLLNEWELEDFDDEKAVRRAPNLAAMLEAANEQATGPL